MSSVLSELRPLISKQFSSHSPPQITSPLLRSLRGAALLTGISCFLITIKGYIGDNINCVAKVSQKEEIKAVESFCFIHSTFTVTNLTIPAALAPHPGLGPVPHREVFPDGTKPIGGYFLEEGDEGTQQQAYYQWVPFMLMMQCALLYLPSLLWKLKQKNYLEKLLAGLNTVHVDNEEEEKLREQSTDLFRHSMNHYNGSYFRSYLACEVLGVVAAFVNLFLTNIFLGDRFFYFGKNAIKYLFSNVNDPNNPLNQVFPKMGKCHWYMYGPTGNLQLMDAMCVLPLNIVNEKTYIVLWVAYILLCAFTSVYLIYHLVLFLVPGILNAQIERRVKRDRKEMVKKLLRECSLGDKFMLWNLQFFFTDFSAWLKLINNANKEKSS